MNETQGSIVQNPASALENAALGDRSLKSKKLGKVGRGLAWGVEAERRVRMLVQEFQESVARLRKRGKLGHGLSGSAGCLETT